MRRRHRDKLHVLVRVESLLGRTGAAPAATDDANPDGLRRLRIHDVREAAHERGTGDAGSATVEKGTTGEGIRSDDGVHVGV